MAEAGIPADRADAPSIVVVGPPSSAVAGPIERAGLGTVTIVPDAAAAGALRADVIVVDLEPGAAVDALHLLSRGGSATPVLAVAERLDSARRLLAAGAKELASPDDDETVIAARVRTLLEIRTMRQLLTDTSAVLEERVRERTIALEEARMELLDKLVVAAEYRDDDTREHTRRVGETSAMLAAKAGMTGDAVATIRLGAPLHDIGKIGVRDSVLLKAGALDDREFDEIRQHSVIGGRIFWGSRSPVLKSAAEIALFHHERWDGRGYPAGFTGEEIPLAARVVAIADVFDALTHERPYKSRWPVDRSLAEMRRIAGTHLDPELTEAFVEIVEGGALERINWS